MIDSKELEAANRMDMFYENLEGMSKQCLSQQSTTINDTDTSKERLLTVNN